MKSKLDDLTKFNILTEIKSGPNFYSNLTMPEIQATILEKFQVSLSSHLLYRWFKTYNFTYKAQKAKPEPSQADLIKRTNQRIRTLGIVIRNLCKELDIRHPNMLDKLLDGITEEYGANGELNGSLNEVKELETKVYESI